jgi:hypothetical protein
MMSLSIGLLSDEALADALWTPSLGLVAVHDDNILFQRTDAEDDIVYLAKPQLKIDYDQEITKFSTDANATIRRYSENDDLDDEVYNFDFKGRTNLSERAKLHGMYEFKKDTTLDSELDEIGRISFREERISHKATLSPSFNLTERTSIGLNGRYRNVEYDSDNFFDYSSWGISLPVRRRLVTQVDSIYVSPGYSYRESDANTSDNYTFTFGWDHEKTERLNLLFSVGVRYSEFEYVKSDKTDEVWGGLGTLQLNYDFLTGSFMLDLNHNLQNTASGNQANVSRLWARLKWEFSQRLGMVLNGRYYYTQDEEEEDVDDDSSQFYKLDATLLYHLTENHFIFIAYEYSQDKLDNVDNDPRSERNRAWAGIRFNFPMQ